MGFHRRLINNKIILDAYLTSGIYGIRSLFTADAYILDDLGEIISDLIDKDKNIEIDNILQKIIKDV